MSLTFLLPLLSLVPSTQERLLKIHTTQGLREEQLSPLHPCLFLLRSNSVSTYEGTGARVGNLVQVDLPDMEMNAKKYTGM